MKRYKLKRACRLICDTDHYGPWTDEHDRINERVEKLVRKKRKSA